MEEGVKNEPYLDSLGYRTIGIGHLIDKRKGGYMPKDAQAELDKNGRISNETISKLYADDLSKVVDQLKRELPWVLRLDPVRRDVLIDMCFQMGIGRKPDPEKNIKGTGLQSFSNSLRYIENGDYEQAAKNMLVSKWAKQTPNRAKRRADEMRTGIAYNYN